MFDTVNTDKQAELHGGSKEWCSGDTTLLFLFYRGRNQACHDNTHEHRSYHNFISKQHTTATRSALHCSLAASKPSLSVHIVKAHPQQTCMH